MIHLLWIIPLILLGIVITVYARRGVRAAGAMVRRIPWGWVLFGLAVCMLLFWGGYKIFSSDDEKKTEKARADSVKVAQQEQLKQPVEALIFVSECWTPCNTYIGYKYKIRGEGNPLRITFWKIDEPIDYPGEGDFKTPEKFQPGDTKFISLNKVRPHVRVQIYKKTTIQGKQ